MPSQLRAFTTQYVIFATIISHCSLSSQWAYIFPKDVINSSLPTTALRKGTCPGSIFVFFAIVFAKLFWWKRLTNLKYVFCNKLNCMPSQLRAVTTQYVIFTTIISLSSLYSQWGYIFPKDVIHGLFHNFVWHLSTSHEDLLHPVSEQLH